MLLAQLGIDPRPLGLGAPQPWPLHHRANCRKATLFSFYLIGFFHSETNVKELAAQPGIDPRPLGFGQHSSTAAKQHSSTAAQQHHYTTVTFLFLLILFLHSWANLLKGYLKGWGAQARNRFSLLTLWAPQPWPLHHHVKGWTPSVFLLYLILFIRSNSAFG